MPLGGATGAMRAKYSTNWASNDRRSRSAGLKHYNFNLNEFVSKGGVMARKTYCDAEYQAVLQCLRTPAGPARDRCASRAIQAYAQCLVDNILGPLRNRRTIRRSLATITSGQTTQSKQRMWRTFERAYREAKKIQVENELRDLRWTNKTKSSRITRSKSA
jgi:hypothetical protein